MDQQSQPESLMDRMKATTSLAIFGAKIVSLPLELMFHGDVGETYLGLAGGCSFLLMMFFPVLFLHSNPGPFYLFTLACFVRWFCYRSKVLWNWWKGKPITKHTQRPGTPWVMRLVPNWSVQTVLWLEPVFCIVLGFGIAFVSMPLGVFLFLGGVGLLALNTLRAVSLRNEAIAVHNRMLEQQVSADSLRGLQGR
jgi:hypothetical protein